VGFGGLFVWTLADCEWRAAAAALRLPRAPGGVEICWLGWQFLNSVQEQRCQAGCWFHQCVLRNTLAGSFRWFLCAGMTQIAASGFLKKVQETGRILGCSFYLPVPMSRNPTVDDTYKYKQARQNAQTVHIVPKNQKNDVRMPLKN